MSVLTPQAFERLTTIVEALSVERGALKGASVGFVDDMKERIERYGARVFVSPKQLAWLENLYTQHVGSLDAVTTSHDNARVDVLGDDADDLGDDIPF